MLTFSISFMNIYISLLSSLITQDRKFGSHHWVKQTLYKAQLSKLNMVKTKQSESMSRE